MPLEASDDEPAAGSGSGLRGAALLAPGKPRLRIISGRPVAKGTLRFVGKISLPIGGGAELVIDGVMAFASHGKNWAALPSKPVLDEAGAHKTDENGRKAYAPILEFSSKTVHDRFSATLVALIRQQFPSALEDEGAR